MAMRTYYCPACDGDIWITVNDSRDRDPQCEREVKCDACDNGFIDSDDPGMGLRPYTPSRRRWSGERHPKMIDVLELVQQTRRHAANDVRRGWGRAQLDYTNYGVYRLRAMRPVSGLAKTDMLAWATRCAMASQRIGGAL